MLVRYWMSKSVVSTMAEMNLEDTLHLMRKHKVRRLPVLDNETLVGIVVLFDLYRFVQPELISKVLLPKKVSEILRAHKVAEVMAPNPHTCKPNTPLEDVGELMRKEKIGAVPVLQDKKLVGIITESDVLGALAAVARQGADSMRITFRIPVKQKIEAFYQIVGICEQFKMELLTLLTHPISEGEEHLMMLRVRGQQTKEFVNALWDKHFEVLLVDQQEEA